MKKKGLAHRGADPFCNLHSRDFVSFEAMLVTEVDRPTFIEKKREHGERLMTGNRGFG